MMNEYFKGKSAIVTGAGRGIGRAITIKLAELGTKVYAVSNDAENLKTLQAECPNVTTLTVDLADWHATRSALEPLPPVDLLVNNAGMVIISKFTDIQLENVDLLYKVLFRAVINVSQIVSKKLTAEGRRGSIVNISSFASIKVDTLNAAYCAMKAAVDNLTRSMAIELAPMNIRVNTVNPGCVPTPLLAEVLGAMEARYGDDLVPSIENKVVPIQDIVNTVLFLLSDAAESITGNITLVDAGRSIS